MRWYGYRLRKIMDSRVVSNCNTVDASVLSGTTAPRTHSYTPRGQSRGQQHDPLPHKTPPATQSFFRFRQSACNACCDSCSQHAKLNCRQLVQRVVRWLHLVRRIFRRTSAKVSAPPRHLNVAIVSSIIREPQPLAVNECCQHGNGVPTDARTTPIMTASIL